MKGLGSRRRACLEKPRRISRGGSGERGTCLYSNRAGDRCGHQQIDAMTLCQRGSGVITNIVADPITNMHYYLPIPSPCVTRSPMMLDKKWLNISCYSHFDTSTPRPTDTATTLPRSLAHHATLHLPADANQSHLLFLTLHRSHSFSILRRPSDRHDRTTESIQECTQGI
jgi:hypothetical protein